MEAIEKAAAAMKWIEEGKVYRTEKWAFRRKTGSATLYEVRHRASGTMKRVSKRAIHAMVYNLFNPEFVNN
jgi:hypothetical protein